ncbi:protein HESO1 [Salvia miltiorrhiza]|uniref:protein HESO1 n=1 Tax=Salvia miltiorrhiza TaxID=226208 RepID=UPI0025AD1710|nr:protein HESO1 [Salvia miltiorrhiza]XP_057804063.1 protein HESO1 [Salvia miltiorrhiza]XP_057804064.1 protein HESO1 [Salvia miltiorrhiza]
MNGYNQVEQTLNDILRAINPSKEDWTIRFHIINEVRDVIRSIESLRGGTVEPYGSFVSNLFTKWGDLDISIELPNGSYISSPGKKHKQTLLADVIKALRKKGGFRRLQFISNARVPIVKFEGNFNISCDLSVNNLSGQMKSKILFWISGIDNRFRDLVLLVKEWAKTHHINDSKSGTLNSYCLSLLVLFHFQTLEPAILPPLIEIYPGNMTDDLTGVRAVAEKNIEDTCAVNIKKIRSDRSRSINWSSLSELFLSFLAKFSDICSRASTQGINPYMGHVEDINTNMRWLPRTYALFVEDPFEQPANTARTVSSNQLIKIAEAIQVTHQMLASPNQNQASLFSVLVGPHLSWLGRRTSVSTSTIQSMSTTPISRNIPIIRNGIKTRPERKQPPLQTLHKSQNKVMDKPQNGESNGSKHASTSQKQQVWRPRSEPKAEKNSSGE